MLAARSTQSQAINTVVGNGTAGFSGDGGPAINASLNSPAGVVVDAAGTIYIVDQGNNRIRKVDANGIITTVVGNGAPNNAGDGGPAISAAITPTSVALDEQGNLFIGAGNVVRKVSTGGIITTVAGNGTAGFSGDGGPAAQAGLNTVSDVIVDRQGNLFIADRVNYRVRKVDNSGIITTVAGNGSFGYSGDNGPATSAQVVPIGLTIDDGGNLFITHISYGLRFSSQNQHIRKVNPEGIITTVAGDPTKIAGIFSGDGGPATQATLSNPRGIAYSPVGNLFFADNSPSSRVRRINSSGIINTVAGNGDKLFNGDTRPATQAAIDPVDVAFDSQGRLYIADYYNNRIRRVDLNNLPPTLVGGGISSPRSATVSVPFALNTAGAFTDPEGRSLTYSSSPLPAGLILNPSTGLIAGTPANPGLAGITVVATDDGGNTANSGFFLTIESNPTINQPPQLVGNGLSSPLSATIGVPFSTSTAYAFRDPEARPLTFISSPMPAGLSLNPNTGVISGTPLNSGTAGITMGATDDGGSTAYSGFFLNIQSGVVVVGSGITSPQSATVGVGRSIPTAYAFADPSGRPLRYASSPLPAGLSLDPNTGVISGTPLNPGTAGITVVATTETNVTVYSGFYLNIVLDPSVNVAPRVVGSGISSPQSGTVGVAFSTPTAYAFSDPEGRPLTYSSSSLPDGLSINPSTGVISGTPSRAYTFGVTVGATDDGGSTVYSGFFVTIINPGGGRVGVHAEAGRGLQVRVLGNPVVGEAAQLEIVGAAGQSVWLRSYDQQGRLLGTSTVEQAGERERTQVGLGSAAGLYYVQVGTAGQQQLLKVLKR